jgi:hypothetical protein
MKTNNITLIQLVSAQAMQNLLAALALRPARIVHLCTQEMEARNEALSRAYHVAGINSELQVEHLSRMPEMPEIHQAVYRIIGEAAQPCVVNFTGGTKLMAIGAYAAALQAKCSSLYVDTLEGKFLDGKTGQGILPYFKDGDLSLSQVTRQLRVDMIAVANGRQRVTGGQQWEELLPVADLLLRNEELEEQCHAFAVKVMKTMPRRYKERQLWDEAVRERQFSPPQALQEALQEARLFERAGNGMKLSRNRLLDSAEKVFSFLQGSWWEVSVAEYLKRTGRYRDLRWSVDVGASDGQSNTNMEEDILGVHGVNLLYVSCKRGGSGAKLARLLEEVAASAERIGGSHSMKLLAVYKRPYGRFAERIYKRADELRICIVSRDDLLRL